MVAKAARPVDVAGIARINPELQAIGFSGTFRTAARRLLFAADFDPYPDALLIPCQSNIGELRTLGQRQPLIDTAGIGQVDPSASARARHHLDPRTGHGKTKQEGRRKCGHNYVIVAARSRTQLRYAPMPVHLALYGAGDEAEPWLKALAARNDVRLLAVCDPLPRLAQQAAAGWGARTFAHYSPMLSEEPPDVLLVAVPPRALGDVLDQAVARGIPFLVTPPGAIDWDHARRLARQLHSGSLPAAVAYLEPFTDIVREARDYLASETAVLARGLWRGPSGDAPFSTTAFWAAAPPLMQLVTSFLGPIDRLVAVGDASLAVTCQAATGAVAQLSFGPPSLHETRLELDLLAPQWELRFTSPPEWLRLTERDKSTSIRNVNTPHQEMLDAFLLALRQGTAEALPVAFANVLPVLAVCEAVQRSLREQRWVDLAEFAAALTMPATPLVPFQDQDGGLS